MVHDFHGLGRGLVLLVGNHLFGILLQGIAQFQFGDSGNLTCIEFRSQFLDLGVELIALEGSGILHLFGKGRTFLQGHLRVLLGNGRYAPNALGNALFTQQHNCLGFLGVGQVRSSTKLDTVLCPLLVFRFVQHDGNSLGSNAHHTHGVGVRLSKDSTEPRDLPGLVQRSHVGFNGNGFINDFLAIGFDVFELFKCQGSIPREIVT
mmetsp:Transcript_26873/g.62412  ORF Transcript_26873/g.62412 Transcript_26873/m.62412 type:complete len:206 (+) Transcript_26873:480-1097(+)